MKSLLLLPAAAVLALVALLLLFPPRDLPVGPAPTPGDGTARAPATPPPASSFPAPEEAFPAEAPVATAVAPPEKEERPPLAVGRLVNERGEALAGVEVYLGGEALLLRLIENARGPKLESVRIDGQVSLVRLEEGALPLAFPVGRTRGNGSFSVPRPPHGEGGYELLFVAPEGTVLARARPFVPEPGITTDLGTITAPDPGGVAGRVVTEDGRAVVDAEVWCLPLDRVVTVAGLHLIDDLALRDGPFGGSGQSREAVRAMTDDEGRYELVGVRPGSVRVYVRGSVAGAVVSRVPVSRGATTEAGKIVLDRAGAFVSGRVVAGEMGEPVEGVHVLALGTGQRTRTAADGTWRLGPLAPGEAKLMATLGQRVGFSQPIQLIAGRHLTGQTIELPEE